jgi:CyaY protein
MTETEFLAVAESTLGSIEAALERASDSGDIDIECSRSGNVLEIEFVETGSKIIVNSQAAMQEIWVAARSGGFHYRYQAGRWLNTRDGTDLYAVLSKVVSEQGGVELVLG